MSKIQIIKIPDQDFQKLRSKIASDQSPKLEFETLPYRTKKRSRKKILGKKILGKNNIVFLWGITLSYEQVPLLMN